MGDVQEVQHRQVVGLAVGDRPVAVIDVHELATLSDHLPLHATVSLPTVRSSTAGGG